MCRLMHSKGRSWKLRLYVNVLQDKILMHEQAYLSQMLSLTIVDEGNGLIQDLANYNRTGYTGRNYRIMGGIVNQPKFVTSKL